MNFEADYKSNSLNESSNNNKYTNKEEIERNIVEENTLETETSSKKNVNSRKYVHNTDDIKLINSPTRIQKSTYPIILYVNHDEIDLTNDWGWVGALRLFCDYCALVDHDKFLTLGDTKRGMGICLSRTKDDLLVNVYTDQKKIVNWWGVWFNLDVPSKRDLGVAIFNIGDFMGFHCVAMEVKKWDNSEF